MRHELMSATEEVSVELRVSLVTKSGKAHQKQRSGFKEWGDVKTSGFAPHFSLYVAHPFACFHRHAHPMAVKGDLPFPFRK